MASGGAAVWRCMYQDCGFTMPMVVLPKFCPICGKEQHHRSGQRENSSGEQHQSSSNSDHQEKKLEPPHGNAQRESSPTGYQSSGHQVKPEENKLEKTYSKENSPKEQRQSSGHNHGQESPEEKKMQDSNGQSESFENYSKSPLAEHPLDGREDNLQMEETEIPKRKSEKRNGGKFSAQKLSTASIVSAAGKNVPLDKTVVVVLHVLIPKHAWGWSDEHHVHVRFDHQKLGRWKKNFGEFKLVNRDRIGLLEFECRLRIETDLIMKTPKGLKYLYYVGSNHIGQEVLTDERHKYCRRLDIIVKDKMKDKVFDQYDSMAFPYIDPKNKIIVKQSLQSLTLSHDKMKFAVPDYETMQHEAMLIYLDNLKTKLCNFDVSDVQIMARSIMKVYTHLNSRLFCLIESETDGPDDSIQKKCEQLNQNLVNFLLEISEKLYRMTEPDAAYNHGKRMSLVLSDPDNGKRMSSALIVLCCFDEMIHYNEVKLDHIHFENVSALLSMLELKPDINSKKYVDFNVLKSKIPEKFQKEACNAIRMFIEYLIKEKQFSYPQWLFALPVLHFLSGASQPFEEIILDPHKIKWPGKEPSLTTLRTNTYKGNFKFVQEVFNKLQPLTVIDSLLLYQCVYICPRANFHRLISKICPFISTAFLASQLEMSKEIIAEEAEFAADSISTVVSTLQSRGDDKQNRIQKSTFDASSHLLHQTLYKLKGTMGVFITFLTKIVTLVLESASVVRDDKYISRSLEKACSELEKYIDNSIGGTFGTKTSRSQKSWNVDQAINETKIWNAVLLDGVSSERVRSIWLKAVNKIVRSRLRKIDDKRIELFIALDSLPECHGAIINVLIETVVEKISSVSADTIEKLFSSTSSQQRNVFKILENILHDHFPHQSLEVSFEDLISWDKWPVFLKIYNSLDTKSTADESRVLSIVCGNAKAILNNEICHKIIDGSISLGNLISMKAKRDCVSKLLVDNVPEKLKASNIMGVFNQRIKECQLFCDREKHLHQICRAVNIKVKGLPELMNEIKLDYSNYPIKDLCKIDRDNDVTFIALQSAFPLDDITDHFNIMYNVQGTDLFRNIWNDHIKKERGSELTIDSIKNDIWKPTFEKCQCLLDSIHDRSIKLADVDYYFKNLDDTISFQLKKLSRGVEECMCIKRSNNDCGWIDFAVHLMDKYWSLLNLARAADLVVDLKVKLDLSGDFSVVENIAQQQFLAEGSKSLDSIEGKLVEAGEFLKNFNCDDSRKLRCLESFASSLNIVHWITKETQEVNDLNKFVSVALHTGAGEGDLASDKLSRLKIVGSGYGPLIYDLQKEPSFSNFMDCCERVWKVMEHNPDLPRFLSYCDEEIEWYKSVKGTQGSVEITSYGQMDNIFEYGCYMVGTKNRVICNNLNQVICLTLKNSDKRLAKSKYGLEELRDLESKLVLITGSKAENRESVKIFVDTLQSVYRVADVLLSLQQVGNVKYISWFLKVPCLTDVNIISSLQSLAKNMESELSKWKEIMNNARQDFYELNYYTTIQLLTLRRELGVPNIPPTVLVLLQSISSQITSDKVNEVVRKATFIQQQQQPLFGLERMHSTGNSISKESDLPGTVDTPTPCINSIPKLTVKELTDDERKILNYVTKEVNCSEMLVLMAFELHERKIDKEECEEWCALNMKHDKFIGSNEDESDDASVLRENTSDSEEVGLLSLAASPEDITENLGEGVIVPYVLQNESKRDKALEDKWQESGPTIYEDSQTEARYLTLQQLGKCLKMLNKIDGGMKRTYLASQFMKIGHPNLWVVPPDQVLKSTLHLYMENSQHPLPTPEEVLLCDIFTTAEEIELLWRRAINDPDYKRIFCLVHAEKLSYQVSDAAQRSLLKYTQGKTDYRLVIICSNQKEETSYFISKLYLYKRPFVLPNDINKFKKYLADHFIVKVQNTSTKKSKQAVTSASAVDYEKSCVRIVNSYRSGMGKSLYIQRLAENLRVKMNQSENEAKPYVIIPLHGPVVTTDVVLELFKDYFEKPTCCIYHIDVSPDILWQVDTILFSLLILHGLCDSQGRVWRCHPNQLYAVEVTMPSVSKQDKKSLPENQTLALLNLLPTVSCQGPRQVFEHPPAKGKRDDSLTFTDSIIFNDQSYQRVFQYLRRHDKGASLDKFSFTSKNIGLAMHHEYLQYMLNYCGVKDPSWSEISYFIKFLDHQLQSCEESVYLKPKLTKGMSLDGMKTFVVKFMIRMSRDFSTSSLRGEVALENAEEIEDDHLNKYQISDRRHWEQSPHPYLVFNQDGVSITFVGFIVTKDGDLLNSNGCILERNIMSSKLFEGLRSNTVNFNDKYERWTKKVMIQKIGTVMGLIKPHDPDRSYVLTVDNVTKILAILMRFRCGIPVVIMGETGCGKTRLIRYMCDLAKQGKDVNNLMIFKVHGGTTEKDIKEFIRQAEEEYAKNVTENNIDTVVFFDEVNTTDAIGLIKEIMCDGRILGKHISSDLKFIAACNPYRKHSEDMIKKLECAGLGFFVKEADTQQRLGKIPLRQLVYRVLDLPPSMRPLVYDYGQLNAESEKGYILQIVRDHILHHSELRDLTENVVDPVARVLTWSQSYMRRRKDECGFVSLRDVERAMIVFKYMFDMMDLWVEQRKRFETADNDQDDFEPPSPVTRALILSLSVCYHARLLDRTDYETKVVKEFTRTIKLSGGPEQFRNEIRWFQEVLLDNMQVGDNIARNAALRENVFMMAVCVELRIPLFLVGKPGSSKSLAKSIINESMRGKDSKNDLLKKFKEVDIFSYQCSQLSTSASVIEVFDQAKKFQANHDKSSYVAIVVLDEVGLAEDSPNLPLKALHPLLEDGTEGAKKSITDSANKVYTDQVIARQERVAFIGISNWALDPAKMNRGVMVTRADPSKEELVFSARGICSNKAVDPIRKRLEIFFEPFAIAYLRICDLQDREFFGLRDFYSLIKMLYYMCEKSKRSPTWPQLEHAIRRNFGGLESKELDPLEEFKKVIPINRESPDLTDVPEELHCIMDPDCSRLGLIKTSLNSREKTWHGENRYILFLTENYAALDILKNYLGDSFNLHETEAESTDHHLNSDVQPFILFGSSFPKDKEYTQFYRNINQIKICMETGRTVILLNLENLYESLYDVLNQYYIYHAGTRYVDLGLQTHRVRCRVDDNFKLILIAEKDTVYEKFPTPLINRLEKHFILTSSILEKWQEEVLIEFEDWISKAEHSEFKKSDTFIGFQKDTPASIIFQATNLLRSACTAVGGGNYYIEGKWSEILKWSQWSTEDYKSMEEGGNQDAWKESVLNLSKFIILQIAAPEAIVRLDDTELADEKSKIEEIYFTEQCHDSLKDFLKSTILKNCEQSGILMQVTTRSHLLSQDELQCVATNLRDELKRDEPMDIKVASFFLHEFDTELDFVNKVSETFKQSDTESRDQCLVIIQCDSDYSIGDLIACARYRIYDLRANADRSQITHILFIIHIPRQVVSSSFISFQGDPWISSHIDDLRPSTEDVVSTSEAIKLTISELFLGVTLSKSTSAVKEDQDTEWLLNQREGFSEESRPSAMSLDDIKLEFESDHVPKTGSGIIRPPLYRRLHGCIQAAASKGKATASEDEDIKIARRYICRVEILTHLIPTDLPTYKELDFTTFYGALIQHIFNVLQERDKLREDEKDWVFREAGNAKILQHGGTFCNVLCRRIDEIVIPIFSEIIATIDRNCNLDIFYNDKHVDLSKLWLSIFRDPNIMRFTYTDMVTQRPVVRGRKSGEHFSGYFPFSWLIHEAVQSQWDNAKRSADDRSQLHDQLNAAIKRTPIGEVLGCVDKSHVEYFYERYLHDFIRLVHKCNHEDNGDNETEYDLVRDALNELVHGHEFPVEETGVTFIHRITALYIAYEMNKSQLLWLGELISHSPSLMNKILKDYNFRDSDKMILHLCAAESAIDSLIQQVRQLGFADNNIITAWLNEVHTHQNAIGSIISMPCQSEIRETARQKWEAVRVLQLLLEHVILNFQFKNYPAYLKRLILGLQFKANFSEAATLKIVQDHMNQMIKEVKWKMLIDRSRITDFKRQCHYYFMDVVSSLCFGGIGTPEPDLIRMLISLVFTEDKSFVLLYSSEISDAIPVIRSSILQLLLEHNSDIIKGYLEEYFEQSRRALGANEHDKLCLLCIQCFEDAVFKEISGMPTEDKVQCIIDVLNKSYLVLKKNYNLNHTISIGYLEAVAGVRFAIIEIVKLLHFQSRKESLHRSYTLQQLSDEQSELMMLAKDVCTNSDINTTNFTTTIANFFGPAIYLLKLLVRQYGIPCLKKVSEKYLWIIPKGLRTADLAKVFDPFVIYNTNTKYAKLNLKGAINDVMSGKHVVDKFQGIIQNLEIEDFSILLLEIYETITLSYSNPKRSKDDQFIATFTDLLQHLPSMIKKVAHLLLSNKQGNRLPQIFVCPGLSPEYKILGAILVHTVSVLLTGSSKPSIDPFVKMLTNPQDLINAYFPTVLDDTFLEVRRAFQRVRESGCFYMCPRGHPYFVGECGDPMQTSKCNICGAKVGGASHKLRKDNKKRENIDETQTGHALGNPDARTGPPASERNLSSTAMCIIRAIMHSALLWCSCHEEKLVPVLVNLVKPAEDARNLPNFFWAHLKKDIQNLSQVTGKGMGECALIVHWVLHDILMKPANSDIFDQVQFLSSRDERIKWETEFNICYIQPVLKTLDARLNKTWELVANEDKEGQDKLFHVVYEKGKIKKKLLEPHLWSYHEKISLGHLGQTLEEKDLREKYPLLYEFIRVEPSLRATQYLPDIVKLQRSLFDLLNHRVDRKQAKEMSIDQFLNSLKAKSNYSFDEFNDWLTSLQKAWVLVGQIVKTHGRLHLEDEHCLPAITKDVSLEYLIPTTVGAGALTTSLVDYLVLTHNDFIQTCYKKVMDESQCAWIKNDVPIAHLHQCHLLDYEQQILSVVLSHCCYSLKVGEAHSVRYEHQALEKHIVDKFVFGKPTILLSDIPQVVYCNEIYTRATFDAVRQKVHPQVKLELQDKEEILSELHTPDKLRSSLDVIEIVLGFVSSGGTTAEQSLGDYLVNFLKMNRQSFSQKAQDHCKLKHVLSLWETLSVELSKLTWLGHQEPFESIKEKHLLDLSEEDDDNQKAALDKYLRSVDLDRLLGALFEFIETYLKYSPDNELEWPIKDVIVEGQFDHLDIDADQFSKDFPPSITLAQTVAVWKHIVNYQERL